MFKKLKSQIKDSVSPVLASGTNYLSNTIETMSNSGRTRRDSHSSVASDTTGFLFSNYTSPSRSYYPPSDIESEVESESGDRLNKLLDIYKNKYAQLKNAFAESEAEKEKIKKILTDSQDRVLKRVQELRDQVECEKTDRAHLELKLAEKDKMIESLKNQEESSPHGNLIDLESIDDNESKEKMEKLQILLVKCRKLIENQKQDLIKKDDLISEQKVEIDKLKPLVEEKNALETKVESLQDQIDKMKSDFESREVNFNEERSILQQNLERSNKRCNDLSMELEEKGNLFQKQFQLFQVEFNEKEENLAYRLKLLQQDYNNLEQELISEKANKTKAESEKEINDKVEKISNEKKEMEKHYENLIKDLNIKIVKYDDDIAKLESEIVGKDKELNNLKLKEENNVNLDELNKTLESKDKEITNIKNTNESVSKQNEDLQTEIKSLQFGIEELSREKNSVEEKVKNLGELLESEKKERQILDQTKNEKEFEVKKLNEQIEKISTELEESRTRGEKLEQDCQNNASINDNLKKELDTSQSEVNNLKSEKDTLSKELVQRDKRIEVLIEKANESELSLNDLDKKIQEKNTEMESMKKSMLEKEQNVLNENQMLKSNINQLNDQHKQSIELIENLKKEKTELETRTSEMLSENEKSFSVEIERLKQELNRIESEKLTAERTIEALEKQKKHFEDSKLEMERLIGVKDGQLDNLNIQIKSEEENKILLTKKVSDLELKMSESLRKNEKLHIKEIENLREEISRIGSEKILADEEIEGLNKRISLLNDEIAARTIQIEELQQNEKNLIHRFQVKESQMLSEKDREIEEFKRECGEKLKNSQIDISSLQERLDQANKDYRASIEKIQQTRKQHLTKIKKKLQHCASILSLMDKLLFQSNETDQTILTLFLSSLTEPKKNDESLEEKSNFEFDEAKFRELIESKKNHFEKLDQLENLNQEIKKLAEINQNLQQEIVLVKSSSIENETKLSNEKIKISNDFQQKIDELQLKIDNLDLKNKQLQSEENRESHNLKTKILDLENELCQVRKHNDELVSQLKLDVESKEKNLMNVKKQADLRMASIKKKFENESQSKLEEINAKNYDLELKIKEKNKLIEMFKTENDNNVIKMNQLEEELEKKFVSEKLILQEDFGNRVKNYESMIEELNLRKEDHEAQMTNDKNNLVSSLRNENSQLSRKLDDLQFAYDELLDEKNNLKFNLNKIKENGPSDNQEANRLNSLLRDRERVIYELEQKLSLYVNKSAYEDSLGYVSSQNLKQNNSRSLMMESSDQDSLGSKTNLYNHCLESTEIDYLRQIVYSYMMGIDPVTMAKVIVAVLKFSEEDRKKILENERQRHLNWFPNLVNK